MIRTYRKKPELAEAVLYSGDNQKEIEAFIGVAVSRLANGSIALVEDSARRAAVGDFVVRRAGGDVVICTRADFEKTYDPL